MFNAYDAMRSKYKKEYDGRMHFTELLNVALSMFDIECSDTIIPENMEQILLSQGDCGILRNPDDGKLYTGPGSYCGEWINGLPTEYQITVTGIGTLRGKVYGHPSNNPEECDAVVIHNNALRTPDWQIMQTASILTEVDTSERLNVIFSRLLRIPRAKDNKDKAAIEAGIKAIVEGRIEAITSGNVFEDVIRDNAVESKFLDLVDSQDVDKLQYLNQYRDNVVKRFFQNYGMGMQTTAKLAQQTTDELHGYDTIAMISPEQKLKYRLKAVDQIKECFGETWSYKFSKCWLDSEGEMEQLNTDGSEDTVPEEKEVDENVEKV